MKKTLCLLFAVLLCGCNSTGLKTLYIGNISFDAVFTLKSTDYCVNYVIDEGDAVVTVKSPVDIKDITYYISKDDASVDFNGINYTDEINPDNLLYRIYDVLRKIQADDFECDGGENCTLCGNGYKATFSPGGLPISLELDNTVILFENVKILKATA